MRPVPIEGGAGEQRLKRSLNTSTPSDSTMTLEQAVWVDPGRMSGAPCFRDSRLPVQQLFDWLADGVSLDEFIEDFRIDRAAAEVVLRTAGAQLCRQRREAL